MKASLKLPPTRNHRQLAAWINTQRLFDAHGREISARVDAITTNTDRKLAGTRLRHEGRGRAGLVLEIWVKGATILNPDARLYRHASSETYRRHSEAREWVEQNLHQQNLRRSR